MSLGLAGRQIWLYQPILDFRKQVNGLVQIIITEMAKRPNDGAIYIFRNRQRDKLKLLMWDRNGFIMGYKRLERGKFDIPTEPSGPCTLTWDQLEMLMSGMPLLYLGKESEEKMIFS